MFIDYINISDSDDLDGMDALTIEAWAKSSSYTNPANEKVIVSKWDWGTAAQESWGLRFRTTGAIRFFNDYFIMYSTLFCGYFLYSKKISRDNCNLLIFFE